MDRSSEYEFRVAERLSATAIAAFDELSVDDGAGAGTVFSGTVRDQAHLYGLIARFQSLGLTIEGVAKLRDSRRRG